MARACACALAFMPCCCCRIALIDECSTLDNDTTGISHAKVRTCKSERTKNGNLSSMGNCDVNVHSALCPMQRECACAQTANLLRLQTKTDFLRRSVVSGGSPVCPLLASTLRVQGTAVQLTVNAVSGSQRSRCSEANTISFTSWCAASKRRVRFDLTK